MTIFEDEVLEMCFRSVQLRCFDNKDLTGIKVIRWNNRKDESYYHSDYQEIYIDKEYKGCHGETIVRDMIHELMHYVYRRTKHCKKWRKLEQLYNELYELIDLKTCYYIRANEELVKKITATRKKIKRIERNFKPTW